MMLPAIDLPLGALRPSTAPTGPDTGSAAAGGAGVRTGAVPPVTKVAPTASGKPHGETDDVRQERGKAVDGAQRETERDADAASAKRLAASRYRYDVKFLNGLTRPLVQLIDTETDGVVSSYPPEQMARLLEDADRLGQRSTDQDQPHVVDSSA